MFIELLSVCTLVQYASLKNRPYQAIPTIVYTNSNKTLLYPFIVIFNKCFGNDPYARVYVPNKVKNMNVKVLIECVNKQNKV